MSPYKWRGTGCTGSSELYCPLPYEVTRQIRDCYKRPYSNLPSTIWVVWKSNSRWLLQPNSKSTSGMTCGPAQGISCSCTDRIGFMTTWKDPNVCQVTILIILSAYSADFKSTRACLLVPLSLSESSGNLYHVIGRNVIWRTGKPCIMKGNWFTCFFGKSTRKEGLRGRDCCQLLVEGSSTHILLRILIELQLSGEL